VSELADLIDEKPIGVIKFLMTDLGIMASMTRSLDPQTIVAVVEGFGMIVGGDDDEDEDDDEYVGPTRVNQVYGEKSIAQLNVPLSSAGMTKKALW
jgi:Translation initiation factor IF-2, N-terminal region